MPLYTEEGKAFLDRIVAQCNEEGFEVDPNEHPMTIALMLVDHGKITPNQSRAVFGFEPINGGDTLLFKLKTGICDNP